MVHVLQPRDVLTFIISNIYHFKRYAILLGHFDLSVGHLGIPRGCDQSLWGLEISFFVREILFLCCGYLLKIVFFGCRNTALVAEKGKLRSWVGPNGQYYRELPCPNCRGRGYTPCKKCGIDRSSLDCPMCNGKVTLPYLL